MIFQYSLVMVLLESILLLSVAVFSNLFRVLAGDVSCTWPAPDFPRFFPYGGFCDRFFLATLVRLHVALVLFQLLYLCSFLDYH